jgi:hypothetical protein
MANITIVGGCYVIASRVSMADLELVKKHRPKALKITDEETKETLFAISTGGNSVTDYGINFSGVTNDDDKLAAVTMPIPADVENATEYVADKAGTAVINLNRIEAVIGEVLEDIRAERRMVTDNITVVV